MYDFFKLYPVKNATKADAINYVSILFSLAAVDGVDANESNAIKNLVKNNGWDPDIFEKAKENIDIKIESLNLTQEFIDVVGPYLIRDLCAIAHISNGFSDEEDKYIDSIREKLGISTEKYAKIKKSVSSQFDVIENWSQVLSS